MSWVVAVWREPRPASPLDARRILEDLAEVGDDDQGSSAPDPQLVAYVERLIRRWPDISDDEGQDSPWADSPLMANISGGLFLCALTASGIEEGLSFMIEAARELDLVCFDTQTDEVYVPTVAAAQLPQSQRRRLWPRRR